MTQQHNTTPSIKRFEVHNHVHCEPVSPPQWSRDDWYDYLSLPCRQLVELHALTEDRFLHFGSFLRDFNQRAMSVTDLATSIRDRMVGDETSGAIANLQLLVERMSIFLQDIRTSSNRNEQALTSLCATLERLHQPLQAFQRITKTLQVVGITTRVECSGITDSNSNVEHLSDSIRRLGSLIAVNMYEIIDQVSILHSLSKDALRNESILNNGQSTSAMAVVDQARGVLVQLTENRDVALQKSETLTQSSKDVSQSIAEIVSSIQVHDITRQQIEHVTETLDEFKNSISNSFERGDHASRQVLCQEIADGCRLQSEQLQNSSNELSAAVWRIVESLQSLASSVTALANDTRDLGGDTERDGNSFFNTIEPAIESVASVLSENLITAAQSDKAVNEVVNAAETMVQLVDEIERFGAEMKVISLNASIESVHVKAGGSSLGVIADSIQELAREALIQTAELATGLKDITECAKNLGGVNHDEVTGHDGKVTSLVEEADIMLADLRQANVALLDNFATMDFQAESLAQDISGAASSIQVHREASAIIAQGVESLDFITEQFNVLPLDKGKRGAVALFNGIQRRYSMKSERDIHDKVFNAQPLPEEDASPVLKLPVQDSEQTHGLGDNVELF